VAEEQYKQDNARLIALYLIALLSISILFALPPSFTFTSIEWHIFWQLKLPVLVTAVTVGAAISAASACLQVLLKNPLADPGIIGISSGASLVAAAFILLSGSSIGALLHIDSLMQISQYILPIMCFAGALLSSIFIFSLAKWMGGAMSAVILAGIAVSTFCGALVAWMFLLAPPNHLQSLSFWLMGSLHNTTWTSLAFSTPIIVASLFTMLIKANQLNRFYLGEAAAHLSGIHTKQFQNTMLVLVAVLVGVSVSIAGSIAFLGLLVPHFIRRLHGHDNQLVVPLSAILGAAILLICALINTQLSMAALPISMLTASIGAPVFIYVMIRAR